MVPSVFGTLYYQSGGATSILKVENTDYERSSLSEVGDYIYFLRLNLIGMRYSSRSLVSWDPTVPLVVMFPWISLF